MDSFNIDILLNVFYYLSNSSLYNANQTCRQWNQIIVKYRSKLFLPKWIETFKAVQLLKAPKTLGAKYGYFHSFTPLGIKYRIELTISFVLLHIQTRFPETLSTIKFYQPTWHKIDVSSVEAFILPKYFSVDSQIHPTIVAKIFSFTDDKLIKICVFDLKDINNILLFSVDELPKTNLDVFKLLPFFDKTKANYEILSKSVFHHNGNYFFCTKIGSYLDIKFMISNPCYSLNDNKYIRNFHCFKYAISFDNQTLVVYDLTLSTKTPIASFFEKNAYFCHSIDLSPKHFIVLLGEQNEVSKRPKFHYLLFDAHKITCSSFTLNEKTSSFLYDSSVNLQSKNIVHIHCGNRVVKIDLKSSRIIE